MKKRIYIFSTAIACLISMAPLAAQQMRTAYFMDGYTYRYKMNPAMPSQRGYFSFPGIGQLNLGVESNLGLSSLLYPTPDGKLTTFLNASIPGSVMENAISDNNKVNVNVSTPVLSFGWWARKTFHSIDLSVRSNVDVNLPGDLFRFLKGTPSSMETTPDTYDLSSIGARADAHVELAYGFSRQVTDWFSIGARFKFLLGAARASAYAEKFQVTAMDDRWSIDSKFSIEASKLLELDINQDNLPEFALNPDPLGNLPALLSYGGAIDFGLSFDVLKYCTISASVLDLGFIMTPSMTRISTSGEPWLYEGLTEDIDINGSGNIDEQLNVVMEGLGSIYKFTDVTELPKKTDLLAMTVNAGLEFRMPFWQKMSVGALSSTHINGPHTWTEGRFSLNFEFARCFGISANYGISDFGSSAGAALSLHAKGFNLFIGTDSFIPFTELTPQFIPVKSLNTNISFGINFLLGNYHGKLFAVKK